jgi:magnesium transporter
MKTSYDSTGGAIAETAAEGALAVFVDPDDAEKRHLTESLRLPAYDVDSALDPDEVSRLEVGPDGVAMIWKRPRSLTADQQFRFDVAPVGFFLQADRLVIVAHEGPAPFAAKEFHGIRTASDVLLRFLLHTVRHYVGHLKVIKQLSASLEAKISASMENRYLLQMFALSESLTYYLDAIEANGGVLTRLRAQADRLALRPDQLELLDDIVLENNQCARQAQIYSSVLAGLMDARGTIVSNNMNVLLKNLTLINIIFLPLNLIASIGGMSEYSMMTRALDWRVSYALFGAGMVVLGWATWLLVIRTAGRGPQRG